MTDEGTPMSKPNEPRVSEERACARPDCTCGERAHLEDEAYKLRDLVQLCDRGSNREHYENHELVAALEEQADEIVRLLETKLQDAMPSHFADDVAAYAAQAQEGL